MSTCIPDRNRKMTKTTSRWKICAVMFPFIAWGMIALATRCARSASEDRPEPPKQAAMLDSDDAKIAGRFHGQVTGPDGKPLRGARIYLVPFHGAKKYAGPVRARTDADGRFEFDAPDMTYTDYDNLPARREGLLIAAADGHAPDWMHTWGHRTGLGFRTHWDPEKGAAVKLQLAKDDVPIRGRLLDHDGKPLAGARVQLNQLQVPPGRDLDAHIERVTQENSLFASSNFERSLYHPTVLPGLAVETRTDAHGQFTLSGLGKDRLAQLSISAQGAMDATITVMTRDGEEIGILPLNGHPTSVLYAANFTLRLPKGRSISGVVRDRGTGVPIAGMMVGIGREGYPRDGVFYHQTITDGQGRFKITGLDPSVAKQPVTAASAPGMEYLSASVVVVGDAPVVIECPRGIPYRLKLVDEQGKPVEANVTYYDVVPNDHAYRGFCAPCSTPLSRAAQMPDGTYHGFVVPGPGAVMVELPGRWDFRPAHVDPKAFFAPGRTKWTAQEWITTYGTKDMLSISGGMAVQNDYAAIVLVNPEPNSGPLDLSAKIVKDKPRQVSLVDSDGKPVTGALARIGQGNLQEQSINLRGSTFLLTGIHPDRVRRITFQKEQSELIGFLLEQGDRETPKTVRLEPWGTITGRFVDVDGNPLPIQQLERAGRGKATIGLYLEGNDHGGWDAGGFADAEGRFKIGRMIPGQRYLGYLYIGEFNSRLEATVEKVVVRSGEVRELGDLRLKVSNRKASE